MKSAVKRVKGIFLALMYAVLYPIIRFVTYFMYILYLKLGGRLSATEIEKSANDNSFALSIIIAIVAMWIYLVICKLRKKDISEYIHTKKVPLMIFIMSAVAALGTRLIVAVYYNLIQNVEVFQKSIIESAVVEPRLYSRMDFAIAFFSVLIVAPLFEEFLFRGLIMGELKKIMRPWAAILIQAIIFGVSHGFLFQSVFAAFMGIFVGIIYHRTKNILAAAVCHGVFNFTSPLMLENLAISGSVIFTLIGIVVTGLALFYIYSNTD